MPRACLIALMCCLASACATQRASYQSYNYKLPPPQEGIAPPAQQNQAHCQGSGTAAAAGCLIQMSVSAIYRTLASN